MHCNHLTADENHERHYTLAVKQYPVVAESTSKLRREALGLGQEVKAKLEAQMVEELQDAISGRTELHRSSIHDGRCSPEWPALRLPIKGSSPRWCQGRPNGNTYYAECKVYFIPPWKLLSGVNGKVSSFF